MGRPRLYSSPEHAERIRASKQAWAKRNADYLRAKTARARADPGYAAKRKVWYLNAKRARLEAGICPKPLGRPRVHANEEDRLSAKRRASAAYMRRRRAQRPPGGDARSPSEAQKVASAPGPPALTAAGGVDTASAPGRREVETAAIAEAAASSRAVCTCPRARASCPMSWRTLGGSGAIPSAGLISAAWMCPRGWNERPPSLWPARRAPPGRRWQRPDSRRGASFTRIS